MQRLTDEQKVMLGFMAYMLKRNWLFLAVFAIEVWGAIATLLGE
jgi:hypothetical protein